MPEQCRDMAFDISEQALYYLQDKKREHRKDPNTRTPHYIRLGVREGVEQCCGPAYTLDWTDKCNEDDYCFVFEPYGTPIRVVVAPTLKALLNGAELVLVDTPRGKGLKINNPNVSASCGCGAKK